MKTSAAHERGSDAGGLCNDGGDSPHAMQNIGMGGLAGVKAYQGAKDQDRKEGLEDDAMRMRNELHELRMAEGSRSAEMHKVKMDEIAKKLAAGDELPEDLVEYKQAYADIVSDPSLMGMVVGADGQIDQARLQALIAQVLDRKAPSSGDKF